MATQREISKQDWNGNSTIEDINSGSLQRIADAVEKMASSYDSVREERDRYQKWYREQRTSNERLHRRISALQGVITKLKKARSA